MITTHYKTSFLLLAIALTALASSMALARDSGLYFAGYLGLSHFGSQDFSSTSSGANGTLDIKAAPNFAGALGLRLNENIRLEGELSYRKLNIKTVNVDGFGTFDGDGHFKNWTGLLNLYYDFNTHSKFTPYLSGGLGLSHVSGQLADTGSGTSFSEEDYGFTWQAGAGLKYRASDKTAYTLGYRYIDTPDLNMGKADVDHGGHEFRVGLQYSFD